MSAVDNSVSNSAKGQDMTDDDRIKRIALETADRYAQRTETKIEEIHGRVTELATNMSAIRTYVSTLPNKDALLDEIKRCKAEHAAQVRFTFSQWLKIISLILTFVAASKGFDFVIP
jgi:ABC-type multidrug transport system fused ATPase/permease subunit